MLPNILLVLVAALVSIALNNPAGIDVIWVLQNVQENIPFVFVDLLVSIVLNNPVGIDVIWV